MNAYVALDFKYCCSSGFPRAVVFYYHKTKKPKAVFALALQAKNSRKTKKAKNSPRKPTQNSEEKNQGSFDFLGTSTWKTQKNPGCFWFSGPTHLETKKHVFFFLGPPAWKTKKALIFWFCEKWKNSEKLEKTQKIAKPKILLRFFGFPRLWLLGPKPEKALGVLFSGPTHLENQKTLGFFGFVINKIENKKHGPNPRFSADFCLFWCARFVWFIWFPRVFCQTIWCSQLGNYSNMLKTGASLPPVAVASEKNVKKTQCFCNFSYFTMSARRHFKTESVLSIFLFFLSRELKRMKKHCFGSNFMKK